MIVYLAASSDTTTGNTAYVYQIDNSTLVSHKEQNSTGPKALLQAMSQIFTTVLLKHSYSKIDEVVIISNNQYIIDMIMKDQITTWKNNFWLKSNGDAIASKSYLEQVYSSIQNFKENNISLIVRQPESTYEISLFNGICKVAKSVRKTA